MVKNRIEKVLKKTKIKYSNDELVQQLKDIINNASDEATILLAAKSLLKQDYEAGIQTVQLLIENGESKQKIYAINILLEEMNFIKSEAEKNKKVVNFDE